MKEETWKGGGGVPLAAATSCLALTCKPLPGSPKPTCPCLACVLHGETALLPFLPLPPCGLATPWSWPCPSGCLALGFPVEALPLHPAGPGAVPLPGCSQMCWCLRSVGTFSPAAPALLQLPHEHCYTPARVVAGSGPSATGLRCLGLPESTCQGKIRNGAPIHLFLCSKSKCIFYLLS